MQCPKCGSENCQRLEVMYELGTQDINTVSRRAAIGSVAGRGAAGIGSTTTEGQSQTRMAEKASPPETRRYVFAAFFAFMAFLLFSASRTLTWQVIALAIIAACGYYMYKVYHYNSKEWPAQYQYWKDQWACLKCGEVYHHA